MQVSVETTQGLERVLTISVPAEQIDAEVTKRLRQLAKTRRVDGFRPGKVPVSVIKRMYGEAVRHEVAGDALQRNFVEAIVAEKLNPAGQPKMDVTNDKAGEDFEFKATFEVYPEFKVKGLSKIKVEKSIVEINETDVDEMLETLRNQHATFSEVERAAEDGDKAFIDFNGKVDGEEFEGGKAENFELVIGSGRMIPGFEEAVIGIEPGKETVAKVTFPEEYHAENLKGKDAEFDIKVNKIEGKVLPELTEDFVQKFGIESGKVEDLRAEVQKNMQRELDQNLKNQVKEQVLDGLVEQNEIELPKALVDQEIDNMRKQAVERFGGNGANMPELPAELFSEQATKRVKIGLVLGEYIKQEEMKVDDERVDAHLNSLASAYEDPSEVVGYYKSNNELLQQLKSVVLEDQAIDAILNKAKVKEVEKNFKDVMQNAQ